MSRLFTILITLLFAITSAEAADWEIDAAHSEVGFKVKHFGISNVPGAFSDFSGTFSFDKDKIEDSKLTAIIKVPSINTNNEKRDKHLRSCDFFCIEKFGEMTYTSNKIVKKSDEEFEIHGTLNLHGVKKDVVLETEYIGEAADDFGNKRVAFSATAKINRKDFGLKWNELTEAGGLLVGEDVKITLEITGKEKKAA